MNKKKHKKGFTLGEMVTTVAIIGTISAIAIPNYLRMRMQTEWELARQQMRIIGEKMTEIVGKKGVFPDPAFWPNLTADEDELSLTASLSALDDLCFENKEGYRTNQPRTIFDFCAYVKQTDECGRRWSREYRFRKLCVGWNPVTSVHYSTHQVGEEDVWEGKMMDMVMRGPGFANFGSSMRDIISDAYYESWFLHLHVGDSIELCRSDPSSCPSSIYNAFIRDGLTFSQYWTFPEDEAGTYDETYFRNVHEQLQPYGIRIYFVERDEAYARNNPGFTVYEVDWNAFLDDHPNSRIFEVAYALDDPVESSEERDQRVAELPEELY